MNLKEMLEAHKILEEVKPENEDSNEFYIWKELMTTSWKMIKEQQQREKGEK